MMNRVVVVSRLQSLKFIFGVLACLLAPLGLFAQGTAFTYQGRLNSVNSPANGSYDLAFALYDAASGGAQQGGSLTNVATAVSNGLFTVTLDFGNQFPGADRWLEIGVTTNGGGSFATLSPRQPLTATPYALTAANAQSAAMASSVSGAVSASQLVGTIPPANFGTGSITSTKLAAGSVTSSALADGAVTLPKLLQSQYASSVLTFTNPTPLFGEEFGADVAMLGDGYVVVGAYRDDTFGNDSGQAYLFDTNGTLFITFTKPAPAAGDLFGGSLTAVGFDKMLICAPLDDTGGVNAGASYLFNGIGGLLTTFTNPAPATASAFGGSCESLGSDRVLISATFNLGAVYLFSLDGTLLQTFSNPTAQTGDSFGRALASLGDDRILIGASGADIGATNTGVVYLFNTNGVLLTTITNPSPAADDSFGTALAVVGTDRILVGKPNDSTGAFWAGTAYLFNTNGTVLQTFTNPAPVSFGTFGGALSAMGDDKVAISANGNGIGGVVYLFSTNGSLLSAIANPTPDSGDLFGTSLKVLSDTRILVGANGDDTGTNSAGVAHLLSLSDFIPVTADKVRVGAITTAALADGAVTAAKIGGVLTPAQIPGLDAAKIVSGTVADARLSPNVALLNASQTFTSSNRFAGVLIATNGNNQFTGNGSGLTNLNATNVLGVLDTNRIPNLDASKIVSGTLADARHSANVALLGNSQTFTGTNTFTNTVAVTGPFYGSAPYLKFAELKAVGTDGGANVAGTNNFRNFSEVTDTHALGSTNAAGDINLPAGTYQCRISAPGYRVNSHQIRLRTNGGTVLLYGTTEYSDNTLSPSVQSRSVIDGQFTLAAASTLQVQHFMAVVRSPNGLGAAAGASWTDGSPVEVYAVAEFWKIK